MCIYVEDDLVLEGQVCSLELLHVLFQIKAVLASFLKLVACCSNISLVSLDQLQSCFEADAFDAFKVVAAGHDARKKEHQLVLLELRGS